MVPLPPSPRSGTPEVYVGERARPWRRWLWVLVGCAVVAGGLFWPRWGLLRRHQPGDLPVRLRLSQETVGPADILRLEVGVKGGLPKPRPSVTVWGPGGRVSDVNGFREAPIVFDEARHVWLGRWPVPLGLKPGKYRFVATISTQAPPSADPEQTRLQGPPRRVEVSDTKEVRLVWKRPREVPAGLCAVTLESREDFAGRQIPLPDGGSGDWRGLFDWAQFMGADTFWYLGGVTVNPSTGADLGYPWVSANLKQVPLFAREAHARGLNFGVWVQAYLTMGDPKEATRYRYAVDYDPRKGLLPTPAVSLFDERRLRDITELLRRFQEIPEVDMLGLDYIRTASDGGYEMTEEFAREMVPPELPRGWNEWSKAQQRVWLADKTEYRRDPEVADVWGWWRARLTSRLIHRIITEGKIEKPLWTFTLGWRHGQQHGQDPAMFANAGVALDAVMLYECDRKQFDMMVNDWREYCDATLIPLAVGEEVDWVVHQRTLRPSGPEEMYSRLRTATKSMAHKGLPRAMFWHDLSRALYSKRKGPYQGLEWAVAGARAFTELREDWGLHPLRVSIEAPPAARTGQPFSLRVRMSNPTKTRVEQVRVVPIVCYGFRLIGEEERRVEAVVPGTTEQVTFTMTPNKGFGHRGGRGLVAAAVTWQAGEKRARAVTFAALQVQ